MHSASWPSSSLFRLRAENLYRRPTHGRRQAISHSRSNHRPTRLRPAGPARHPPLRSKASHQAASAPAAASSSLSNAAAVRRSMAVNSAGLGQPCAAPDPPPQRTPWGRHECTRRNPPAAPPECPLRQYGQALIRGGARLRADPFGHLRRNISTTVRTRTPDATSRSAEASLGCSKLATTRGVSAQVPQGPLQRIGRDNKNERRPDRQGPASSDSADRSPPPSRSPLRIRAARASVLRGPGPISTTSPSQRPTARTMRCVRFNIQQEVLSQRPPSRQSVPRDHQAADRSCTAATDVDTCAAPQISDQLPRGQ